MTVSRIELEYATDEAIAAEARRRGFIVTEKPGPIGRRYVFERLADDEWQPVGGFIATTGEQDANELCAQWCATIVASSTDTGDYRVAVYEGAELVGSSATRIIA